MSRKEQWSQKEDEILSTTVIRFVSENKTKKAAFLEVSDKLNRTEAACAYRWNKVIKDRQLTNNKQLKETIQLENGEITLEGCINFLKGLKTSTKDLEVKELQKEKDNLLLKQKKLKSKLNELTEKERKMKQMLAILKEAENLNPDNKKSLPVH